MVLLGPDIGPDDTPRRSGDVYLCDDHVNHPTKGAVMRGLKSFIFTTLIFGFLGLLGVVGTLWPDILAFVILISLTLLIFLAIWAIIYDSMD